MGVRYESSTCFLSIEKVLPASRLHVNLLRGAMSLQFNGLFKSDGVDAMLKDKYYQCFDLVI